jgi:hypothetical protein
VQLETTFVLAQQEVYQGYLSDHNWGQGQVLSARVVQELVGQPLRRD